jgi:hypothetical protein
MTTRRDQEYAHKERPFRIKRFGTASGRPSLLAGSWAAAQRDGAGRTAAE